MAELNDEDDKLPSGPADKAKADATDKVPPIEEQEEQLIKADPAAESADEGDDRRMSPDEDADDDRPGDTPDRKAERRSRRERQRLARERSERKLAEALNLVGELSNRLAVVEGKADGATIQAVTQDIQSRASRAKSAYEEAEAKMAAALETNDTKAMILAMRVRDEARDAYNAAARDWQSLQARRNQPQQEERQPSRSAEPPPSPEMIAEYRKFQAKHPWYDPNLGDADSKKAFLLSEAVAAEGYDSESPEYWNELDRRVRRAFRDRYDSEDQDVDDKPKRRNPPVASGREGRDAPPSGKDSFGFSKERLEILREASGGDPKKYQRLVAYAKENDRKLKSQNRTSR